MKPEDFFQRVWKDRNLVAWGLWPASLLYSTLATLRRFGYSSGLFAVEKFSLPIVVIGNLTVGGTGKTPLTIWAVEFLRSAGYSPGVISRGYGRRSTENCLVDSDSTPALVGDEPLVIWRRTGAPVAVARRRADAVRLLMRAHDCNVFISDDGLQHLSIASDLKVLLIDAEERFGNGFCLPAGPLRESVRNSRRCDLTIVNGAGRAGEYSMTSDMNEAVNLLDGSKTRPLGSFAGQAVSAFAGIRHSDRFFESLRQQGIQSDIYSFPDHHDFSDSDFDAIGKAGEPVLMTEKDAVKCARFASSDWWYVRFDVLPENDFQKAFADKVAAISRAV